MKRLIQFSLSLSLALPCYAINLKATEAPFQFGGFWGDAGSNQHINIQGLIGDQFTVNNSSNGNGLVGLGYYINGMERGRFNLLYGINGYYLGSMSVSGTIIQENLFTNLAYSYNIQNVPVYAAARVKVKTNSDRYGVILDAGIGPNFMKTSQYNDTSLDAITIPDHAFLGQNSVAFTATAGIGLRFNQLYRKAPVECGYRFFYLGQSYLNPRTNQIMNQLSTGDTYANAVVCAVVAI